MSTICIYCLQHIGPQGPSHNQQINSIQDINAMHPNKSSLDSKNLNYDLLVSGNEIEDSYINEITIKESISNSSCIFSLYKKRKSNL